jgi:hypothetical protein
MVFKETSTLINSIFSLNENSGNVNIFFDVDCPSLYVIVYFDVKSGLLNQLLDFVQGEKVSHRSVLPNVVAVAHLSSAFEPEKKKPVWNSRTSRLESECEITGSQQIEM